MTLKSERFVILTAHLCCGAICCPLTTAHRDPPPCLWLRQVLILCLVYLEWWTDLLSDSKRPFGLPCIHQQAPGALYPVRVGIQCTPFRAFKPHALLRCRIALDPCFKLWAPTPEPCSAVVVSDMGVGPRTAHALSIAHVDRPAGVRSEDSWSSKNADVDQCPVPLNTDNILNGFQRTVCMPCFKWKS